MKTNMKRKKTWFIVFAVIFWSWICRSHADPMKFFRNFFHRFFIFFDHNRGNISLISFKRCSSWAPSHVIQVYIWLEEWCQAVLEIWIFFIIFWSTFLKGFRQNVHHSVDIYPIELKSNSCCSHDSLTLVGTSNSLIYCLCHLIKNCFPTSVWKF